LKQKEKAMRSAVIATASSTWKVDALTTVLRAPKVQKASDVSCEHQGHEKKSKKYRCKKIKTTKKKTNKNKNGALSR
jgi:hypothetical protein